MTKGLLQQNPNLEWDFSRVFGSNKKEVDVNHLAATKFFLVGTTKSGRLFKLSYDKPIEVNLFEVKNFQPEIYLLNFFRTWRLQSMMAISQTYQRAQQDLFYVW